MLNGMTPDASEPKVKADTVRAYGGPPAYERAKTTGKTKLTYEQWVTVRTPGFKRWFGDWEGLRAQRRLDAMESARVHVPQAWRGLSEEAMRAKMVEALDAMVKKKTVIPHAELGDVLVGRRGAKKTESTSKDPVDMLIAADLEAALPKSILASARPSNEQGVNGYSKLLLPVCVDGMEFVAILTVRGQKDGHWYYNTVTVLDAGQEKRPGSYGSPGALSRPLGETPITGLATFYRYRLIRVNPATVSKAIDPTTGEPLADAVMAYTARLSKTAL